MARGALKMYRGDTTEFTVTAVDADGAPLDLTGAVIWMTGKVTETDTDANAQFQHNSDTIGGIALTDADSGIATITMEAADTEDLAGTTPLFYDVQCVDALGGIQTLAKGILSVLVDVTVNTEAP